MSKDPAFLFYSSDFLTGTFSFTNEQRGCYITLLSLQHQQGHLTREFMLRFGADEQVFAKFKIDHEGKFYNERLEIESDKRRKFTESRKNNVKGINQYNKNGHMTKHMTKHMTSHMENENEIIIDNNKLKLEKGDYKEEKTKNQIFENFRLNYPGTKRGYETEFKNFCKHTDWKIEIEKLNKALEQEITYKQNLRDRTMFCPSWTNLSTWINQRRWEQVFPSDMVIEESFEEWQKKEKIKNGIK